MRKGRTPKTLRQKLEDLDCHLYLLRQHRRGLSETRSHLKGIAAELRTLVCFSSGTEGLLWRLVDELQIDDRIFLHVAGKLQKDHPLARGLTFYYMPVLRGGQGDPRLPPDHYSLRYVVKESEPLLAGGNPLTYEYLIKAVSQQMGSAHEADGLEPALVQLKPLIEAADGRFIPPLLTVTELTLEIGERILNAATERGAFKRVSHTHVYGNVSIVLRLRVKQHLAGRIKLLVLRSFVSEISVVCSASPAGISFTVMKGSREIKDILAQYPVDWSPGAEGVFIFSYCSRTQEARTLTHRGCSEVVKMPDVGWLHASDLTLEQNNVGFKDFVEKSYVWTYERLVSVKDAEDLYELPANVQGLSKFNYELEGRSPFPD